MYLLRVLVANISQLFNRTTALLSLSTLLVLVCSINLAEPAVNELPIRDPNIAKMGNHWQHHSILPYLFYLHDPEQSLSVKEVLQSNSSHSWQPINQHTQSLGYTLDQYWIKTSFQNQSSMANWMCAINISTLDHVEYFLFKNGQQIDHTVTGDLYPIFSRKINHKNLLFPIVLEKNATYTVIFKIQSDSLVRLPVSITSERDFWSQHNQETIFLAFFFGCLTVMAIYNILIYFFTRDNAYLYYVCYVFAFMASQFVQQGLASLYFWPDKPDMSEPLFIIAIYFTIILAIQFGAHFLQLKDNYPIAYKIGRSLFYFYIIIGITALIADYHLITSLMSLSIIPAYIFGIVMPITLWIKGERLAKFFALGWFMFIFSAVIYTLRVYGIIDNSFLTQHSLQIGGLLEVTLFSIALADKINLTKHKMVQAHEASLRFEKEKNEVQKLLFQSEHRAKQELEEKVKERTFALEKANQRLLQLNTIDQLTGIKNRRFFDANLQVELDRALVSQSPLSLLVLDIDHFKTFNDNHGHLVGDHCLHEVAQKLQSLVPNGEDNVARYGGEEFVITLPNTPEEDALKIAEDIRKNIATTPLMVDNLALRLTASIGTHTLKPSVDSELAHLIIAADKALYQAKNLGRNRIVSSSQLD